jgi:hypothetical protein
MADLVACLAAGLLVLSSSCGWNQTMAFRSPSGRNAIEIWQRKVDNSLGTRIDLKVGSRRTQVFIDKRESIVYFVHVYWTPDESQVAIVASGFVHWQMAFDVKSAEPVPFGPIRDQVENRSAIRMGSGSMRMQSRGPIPMKRAPHSQRSTRRFV